MQTLESHGGSPEVPVPHFEELWSSSASSPSPTRGFWTAMAHGAWKKVCVFTPGGGSKEGSVAAIEASHWKEWGVGSSRAWTAFASSSPSYLLCALHTLAVFLVSLRMSYSQSPPSLTFAAPFYCPGRIILSLIWIYLVLSTIPYNSFSLCKFILLCVCLYIYVLNKDRAVCPVSPARGWTHSWLVLTSVITEQFDS